LSAEVDMGTLHVLTDMLEHYKRHMVWPILSDTF